MHLSDPVAFLKGVSVVFDKLFNAPPIVCMVLYWSLFWCALIYVLFSFAIILTRKGELVALLLDVLYF